MKTKILFITILIIGSCKNANRIRSENVLIENSYPFSIDIASGIRNTEIINLSEIADSVNYIILSKEKDILINRILDVRIEGDNYFIGLNRFDKTGKFLNTIGQIGRGPYEYLPSSAFAIRPDSNFVYINKLNTKEFMKYDFNGNYIEKKRFNFESYVSYFGTFECLSDTRFVIFPIYGGINQKDKEWENMIFCGILDQNGNLLCGIDHPAKNIQSDFDRSRLALGGPWRQHTFFNNELVTFCGDTVYKIATDTIYPGFILNWGNLLRPNSPDEWYIPIGPRKTFVYLSGLFFETLNSAYFMVNNNKVYYLIGFNKQSGLTRSMMMKSDDFGFVNDIDGGLPFLPMWSNRSGNVWIDKTDAVIFKKKHNIESIMKSASINPKNQKKLKAFLENLTIEDNPVIRVVYLKSK